MANILKPDLTWVDGRCYRIEDKQSWRRNSNLGSYVEPDGEQIYVDEDECLDSDLEIIHLDGNRYKHSFHVPSAFFPFIVGSKHVTIKKLETETQTRIQIPKPGEDKDLEVIGYSLSGIVSARQRIDLIMETSRKKLNYTHMLAIPMHEEDTITANFLLFKNDVMRNCGRTARGVDDSIFQRACKLHQTIKVLTLIDQMEIDSAIETLLDCQKDLIDPFVRQNGPMTIKLKGVECMTDDPSETHVLYAKIESDETLQELVDKIGDYFRNKGFEDRDTHKLKLHVTLMNSRYRDTEAHSKHKLRESFDATNILKVHKHTIFGKLVLKEINLCEIHSTIPGRGYKITSTIKLNE